MNKQSQAWNEGYSACQAGISYNPYLPETLQYEDWLSGWWTAFDVISRNGNAWYNKEMSR